MDNPSTGLVIFYISAISFAVGIFIRSLYVVGLEEVLFVMLLAVVVGLIAGRRSFAPSARTLTLTSVALFLLALGVLRFEVATWNESHPSLEERIGQEILIEGTIVREPDQRARTTHLYVRSEDTLFLVTTDPFKEFSYGDVVRAEGALEIPQ